MKGNEGKNSGDYFIVECKMPLWHIWALFLRLLGGWGGRAGYLIVVHDIYISCSIQWLSIKYWKQSQLQSLPYYLFFYVCLLYFILWPLLIWIQVLKLPQFSQVEQKSSWVSPAAY